MSISTNWSVWPGLTVNEGSWKCGADLGSFGSSAWSLILILPLFIESTVSTCWRGSYQRNRKHVNFWDIISYSKVWKNKCHFQTDWDGFPGQVLQTQLQQRPRNRCIGWFRGIFTDKERKGNPPQVFQMAAPREAMQDSGDGCDLILPTMVIHFRPLLISLQFLKAFLVWMMKKKSFPPLSSHFLMNIFCVE